MKLNIVFPCFATKASGGHKILYEYINCLAEKGWRIDCFYLPQNTFYQLHLPDSFRKILLSIYIRVFGPSKWFKLNKNVKNYLYSENHIRGANIIVATGIETAKPVMRLPDSCGKKVYFIQDFENWNCTEL